MEAKVTYFDKPGEANMTAVFDCVDDAMRETGIDTIVLSSTTGTTARFAMDRYAGKDVRLVIVPHQFGFRGRPQRFPPELVERAETEGHAVCFATMLFHQDATFGDGPAQVVANFLRIFCQGVKVCVEIMLMAGNAGLVKEGQEIIAVAGTHAGADTALVMNGATTWSLKKAHISRVLCKPL